MILVTDSESSGGIAVEMHACLAVLAGSAPVFDEAEAEADAITATRIISISRSQGSEVVLDVRFELGNFVADSLHDSDAFMAHRYFPVHEMEVRWA